MTGVGTELHRVFRWWGFKTDDNCGCEIRRTEYDQNGVQWCREHRDQIVDDIMAEAKRRKINLKSVLDNLTLFAPESLQRFVLGRIVDVCIKRASKEE